MDKFVDHERLFRKHEHKGDDAMDLGITYYSNKAYGDAVDCFADARSHYETARTHLFTLIVDEGVDNKRKDYYRLNDKMNDALLKGLDSSARLKKARSHKKESRTK